MMTMGEETCPFVGPLGPGVLVLEVANVPPGMHSKPPAGLCSILTGGDTYANCRTFTAVVTIS